LTAFPPFQALIDYYFSNQYELIDIAYYENMLKNTIFTICCQGLFPEISTEIRHCFPFIYFVDLHFKLLRGHRYRKGFNSSWLTISAANPNKIFFSMM